MQLVYPYELPQTRQSNQTYFFRWLDTWQIPLRDLRLQSEVYFAMTYLNDTLAEMLHNLYGEYLVERAEQLRLAQVLERGAHAASAGSAASPTRRDRSRSRAGLGRSK